MMGGYIEFSVYIACLSLILNFYSNFVALLGITSHLTVFLIISVALFGVILRIRIPRPEESKVDEFFGNVWGSYKVILNNKKQIIDNNYLMKVVGHRACGFDAPENSLSALQKVSAEGITAVEFDVMLTADNIPVVFHDDTLTRMADLNQTVTETTYEEISRLDISVNHSFGKNFRGEKIPTLEEYVKYCMDNQIRMFIDLKGGEAKLGEVINNLFKQYPKLYERAVVTSFNPVLIYQIRAKDPNIACSLAWRPYFYSHEDYSVLLGPTNARTSNLICLLYLRVLNNLHQWALWKFGYYILGLSAILLHKDMITRDIIQYWGSRGIRVIAWSVNIPTEKQYFEKILKITYLTDTVINS